MMLCFTMLVNILYLDYGVSFLMKSILIAAVSLMTINAAFAAPVVSYNYAELQAVTESLDDYDCSQNGLNVKGSHSLNNDLFVIGSFTDVSGGQCGSSTFNVGGGYQFMYQNDISVYATLSYEDTSVDEGTSDAGLVIAGGVRHFIMEELEAKMELARHTAFDGSTVFSIGANYWFQEQFAITADVTLGSDVTGFAAGVRMNF